MNVGDPEERGSLSTLVTRRLGTAALATFEQIVCAALVIACVSAGAWAELVTVLLAALFVLGLRVTRG